MNPAYFGKVELRIKLWYLKEKHWLLVICLQHTMLEAHLVDSIVRLCIALNSVEQHVSNLYLMSYTELRGTSSHSLRSAEGIRGVCTVYWYTCLCFVIIDIHVYALWLLIYMSMLCDYSYVYALWLLIYMSMFCDCWYTCLCFGIIV